ncbi:MAG: hypothetical protein JNK04_21810 [Myxococcales bacterium]|nr:hypothetical protein [Myxococcales bacterium]
MRVWLAFSFAFCALWPRTSSAVETACGDLELSAEECEIVAVEGCETRCDLVGVVAACDGVCNLPPDDGCVAQCKPACEEYFAKHDYRPCEERCTAECTASIDDSCAQDCISPAQIACAQDCETTCATVDQDNDTTAVPFCEAMCAGVCENESNRSCARDCWSSMARICEETCNGDDGALFCNGQFVAADDIDACMEDLGLDDWGGPIIEPPPEDDGCSCRATGAPANGKGHLVVALGVALLRRRRRATSSGCALS